MTPQNTNPHHRQARAGVDTRLIGIHVKMHIDKFIKIVTVRLDDQDLADTNMQKEVYTLNVVSEE